MRRHDREIRDFSDIVDVLSRCDTLHLAMNGKDFPYVVPLSFGYEISDGDVILYIHGAAEGLKHDLLARDNRVSAEASICHRFAETEHSITCEYESVIGFGRAERVGDTEALWGLRLILRHCGYPDLPLAPDAAKGVTVYRIRLESITGKRRTV